MGRSEIHRALKSLVHRLEDLGIPYAIIGAMALNEYGFRRATVGIDVLLTGEGLARFKAAWLGKGYVERFAGSRGIRDTENGVPIDVVLAGTFPGDGLPRSIRFPDPARAAIRGESVSLLPLEKYVELKLASGLSAPHRLRDLADVLDLIRILALDEELAPRLDPFVREKYVELLRAARAAPEDEP